VVTSDHGEEFWDHGAFEHGHSLHDEVIRVPLLLRVPGIGGAGGPRRVEEPVGLVDVMPTLLEVMGVGAPDSFQGESLVPRLHGEGGEFPPVFSEAMLFGPQRKAVTRGRYRYVVDGNGSAALYDLDADPGERRNAIADHGDVAAELASELGAWHRANLERAGGRDRGEVLVDMREMERLRSLGYVE